MPPPLSQLLQAWKSLNILVIGDVMLDCYLNGDAERLCQEAPVPVVNVTERQDFPGGAANVAVNVTSLGAKATLLSAIGQDEAGNRLQTALQQRGVATNYLICSDDRATLAKQRVVANSQIVVRFDQGSTDAISLELTEKLMQQLSQLLPSCDAVIISDYSYGILTPEIVQVIKNLQRQYSRPLIIDSKRLTHYQNLAATAVKPNYAETIQLLGLPKQLHQRVEQIMPHRDRLLRLTGAAIVAVTLDTEGAVIFGRDQPTVHIPATPVPANQTSGAGDTFISVLTLALAAHASPGDAAILAAAATAIVVTQPGTTACTSAALQRSLQDDLPLTTPPAYVLEHC